MVEDVTIVNSGRESINSRVLKLSKTLSKGEYQVHVLTWDRNDDYPKREIIDGIHISNFKLKTISRNKYLLMLYYPLWWAYIIYHLTISKPDKVQAMNLYNIVPLMFINKFTNWELIYDIGDSTAHSFEWPRIIMRLLDSLEDYCIRSSDGVINVDPHRKQLSDIPDGIPSTIVMNSTEDTYEEIKNRSISETTYKDSFIIYYGGWITETRGIHSLLEATNGFENVSLVIAGAEPNEDILDLINNSNNVHYKGLVSRERSLELTYMSDLVYAYYDPRIPINRLASPNKLFEAMMCATPIIANEKAEPIKKIIEEGNCGLVTEYGNTNEIQQVIQELICHPNRQIKLGKNGRDLYLNKYSWDKMEERLIKFYDKI